MTPLTPDERTQLVTVAPDIVRRVAGGYLRNTVLDGRTCRICRTPSRDEICGECAADHKAFPGRLADVTGFMTYGVDPATDHKLAQSGQVMYGYKRHVTEHLRLVTLVAAVGLLEHTRCLTALSAGVFPTRCATVPSRSGRTNHPLRVIAENLTRKGAIEATLTPHGSKQRQVLEGAFTSNEDQTGQHVLLLEDTWARGATAQSAALAFKAVGVSRVSVLTIARWIKPSWSNNAAFLDSLPDYDEKRCPWTAADCPSA